MQIFRQAVESEHRQSQQSQEEIYFSNDDIDNVEEDQKQLFKLENQSEQLERPKNKINEQKVAELTEENKKYRQVLGLKQGEITRLLKKLDQVTKRNAELEVSGKTLQNEYESKVQNFKEKLKTITEQIQTKESMQIELEKSIKEYNDTEHELTNLLENYKKTISEKNLQLQNHQQNSLTLTKKVEDIHQQKEEIDKKYNQLQENFQNKESQKKNNMELVQRLFLEMKDLDQKVNNVMSINHDPKLMQKQVQKQFETFLAEKCKLLNENTLLRGRIEKLKENKDNHNRRQKSNKMETEDLNSNMNKDISNSTNDPRLQIFLDKFNDFKHKLDEYEKQKFEAIKEKDMWYDKSVQLEKQLEEFQDGNFSKIKKQNKKKVQSKRKNVTTCSESYSSQRSQTSKSNDSNSYNSQQDSSKKMEIEVQQTKQKPASSLLFNFNKKSRNMFSTSFNSLKICLNCSLIIKKTDRPQKCQTCKNYIHDKCWKKKEDIDNPIVNCNSCARKELQELQNT